ncbi:MAG: cation:proton antiporter [Syntrophomonadaceae bacterium]
MFTLAILVIYICQKLNIPSIVGLLITGVLAGPNGLALIEHVQTVEVMAEVGVILLLFTIGLEFSLGKLLQVKKTVLVGGTLQVALTTLIIALIMIQAGRPPGEAIFIGFLISLSSTAIVMKIIQDRAEIDSPYGRSTLAILIFQDIVIIPMMLFTPLLADSGLGPGGSPLLMIFKAVLILAMLYIGVKWAVPFLLHRIARQRSRELFLISIITICMAVAWFTSSLGLSLSLGAFLAGLLISESEYSHQALGNILPFKDVFTSIFFVSIGMLLDVNIFAQQPLQVISITAVVILIKALVGMLAIITLGFPLRTAVLTGLALGQVGEFSFILSKVGINYGLLSDEFYQLFIAVSVLTMALTPFIIALAPRVALAGLRLPLPAKLKSGAVPEITEESNPLTDHLIIIGYGINGRNLARAAAASGIPYMIIEHNPDTVREEKKKGEPIFFGDATQIEVLQHANLREARVVVVAISDPAATVRITDIVRRMSPAVHIIVRTHYVQEIQPLYEVGANDVITQEFETSIEIFSLVLKKYLVPRDDIEAFIAEVRSDGYEMLRSLSARSPTFQDIKLHHHDAEIVNLVVENNSCTVGKTLAEIDLRGKFGGSILLIQRGDQTIVNPGRDDSLQAGDQVVLFGTPATVNDISGLFKNAERLC